VLTAQGRTLAEAVKSIGVTEVTLHRWRNEYGGLTLGQAKRRINGAQAKIVRRIFTEFAAGKSPRAIAYALNREGVPGPSNRAWGDTTIRGHHARGTGVLRNELYVGRLVWNRLHYIKNPSTGRPISRLNPADQWIVQSVPELRIIDDDLWGRVEARLNGIREQERTQKAITTKFWERRRPKHLLSRLVTCGVCGARLASVGSDYLACSAARRQGTCTNAHSVRRREIEGLILNALRHNLMQPALVAEFIRAFNDELNSLRREQEAVAQHTVREISEVTRQIDALLDAVASGLKGASVQQRLDDLETRKAGLEARVSNAPLPMPRLHPNLAELYRRQVERLHTALADEAIRTEAIEILQGLVETSRLCPTEDGYELELVGNIANMVILAMEKAGTKKGRRPMEAPVLEKCRSSVKVVAGTRNHRELRLPAVLI
jgi:hypothetical protein